MKVDTSNIPSVTGEYTLVNKNGSTEDIIQSILRQDKKFYSKKFCKFADQFRTRRIEEGLKNLWTFVKYSIRYEKDEFSKSLQLSPAALFKKGSGDCKSKTLFVNAVLRCLEIPYITRFTNYATSDKQTVKHVYTVAIINGAEMPIDTVFDYFGQEKKYNYKNDYMTEIIEINGIGSPGKEKETLSLLPAIIPQYYNTPSNDCTIRTTMNMAKLIEIKQKQAYIKQPDDIQFHKISEGTAALQIAIRELEIVRIMKPEICKIADRGISMLQAAVKGNFCPTGIIPAELSKVYQKIKTAEKLQGIKANGHGITANRIKLMSLLRNEVAGFPERFCLEGLWYTENISPTNQMVDMAYTQFTDPVSNYGFCSGSLPLLKNFQRPNPNYSTSVGLNLLPTYGNSTYYQYGRNTKYRVKYNPNYDWFTNEITKLVTDNILLGRNQNGSGDTSVWITNQVNYNLAIERLNDQSGVLTKYINDIYAANVTATPNGTVGSGLFYTFADSMAAAGVAVNPNRLPSTVSTKRGFQDQFIDASGMFSGVSRTNLKALARNGVLFDNGGTQPESSLNSLLAIYEGRANIPGINCPPCPIIAAIASIVVAVIGAIAGAVVSIIKAVDSAEVIDTSASDQARLSVMGPSLMAEQNDFTPGTFGKKDDGSGNKNLLLLGAAGLAAYAISQKDKKK